MIGQLQIGGRHIAGYFPFHCFFYDRRLLLAPGHQDDLPGLEDGADAHRYGFGRYVLLAAEITGGIVPGQVIKRNQPCA